MIKFYHSTMGGGKSAILIAKASLNRGISLVLKPNVDTRDGLNTVYSRNGSSIEAEVLHVGGSFEYSYLEILSLFQHHIAVYGVKPLFIYIDESQFLTTEQVNALLAFSLQNREVIIECYGLLVDFKSNLFEGSKRLIEIADEVDAIRSYDRKGRPAKQNARKIGGEIQREGEQVVLGKEETYEAISNEEYFDYLINGGNK